MSGISAIKAGEVNLQVKKILDAFSSLNSKINTVILQKNLDEEIERIKQLRTKPESDSIPKEKQEAIDRIRKKRGSG